MSGGMAHETLGGRDPTTRIDGGGEVQDYEPDGMLRGMAKKMGARLLNGFFPDGRPFLATA